MAFIEFQVSTQSFLNLLLVARQQAKICPPQGITVGGVSIVVDHFEFGLCTIRTGAPGTRFINYEEFGVQKSVVINALKTQIAQPVLIYATVPSDISDHPNQSPANLVALTVTAILDLNYYAIGPQCYLQVPYNSAEFGPLPVLPPGLDAPALQDQVATLLPFLFPAPAIPFDFANSLSGASVNVENAGVSAGGNGSFLCFATQLGAEFLAQADVFWTPFYAGNITDRRGGSDFVVFFPKDYFELVVELMIEHELAGASGKFDLISGYSTYSNASGVVRVETTLDGNIHLPDPFTTEYVEVPITTDFSISTPHTLTANISIPSRKEVINQVLGPVAGVLQMGGIIGHEIFGLIESAAGQGTSTPRNCTSVSDTQFICSRSLPAPTMPSGSVVRLTQLIALDDGVSFGGAMSIQPLTPPSLQLSVRQFKWGPPPINCGGSGPEVAAAFANSPSDFALLHGTVSLDNNGSTPIYICAIQVLNDPQGAFPSSGITFPSTPLPLEISVTAPNPSAAYFAAPYPCDFLIITTGGTRLAQLDAATALDQATQEKLEAELIVELGNCEQLIDPWSRLHAGFNPKWAVDPPFDRAVEHLWQIDVSGLPDGEAVIMVDAAGKELTRAAARSRGATTLLARTQPGGQEVALLPRAGLQQVAESISAVSKTNAAEIAIQTTQQLLYTAAQVPLPTVCDRIRALQTGGRATLAATGEGLFAEFNVSNAFRPSMLRSVFQSGLKGVCTFQGVTLIYGEGGFYRFDQSEALSQAGSRCAPRHVFDAVPSASILYALTEVGLQVFARDLCPISAVEIQSGAVTLLRAGDSLLAASGEHLFVFSLQNPQCPHLYASFPAPRIAALVAHPTASGQIVAVLEDGSGQIFELSGYQLADRGNFAQAPWFTRSVKLGSILATLSQGGGSILLSVLAERQVF